MQQDFLLYIGGFIQEIINDLVQARNMVIDNNIYDRIQVDFPKYKHHGDIAVNAALVLSKSFKIPPLKLAGELADSFTSLDFVEKVDVIKPGFINLFVKNRVFHEFLANITPLGKSYGSSSFREHDKVLIEYVSANPTGPLHVGHGRGAVIGDILGNLYSFLGYNVLKEYYINDSGNQITILAKSLYYRYLELLGRTELFPNKLEDYYPGEYLIDVAKIVVTNCGEKWLNVPYESWLAYFREFAVKSMMQLIKDDLAAVGIKHDSFISETEIANSSLYHDAIAKLKEKGYVYLGILEPPKGAIIDDFEPKEQLLFRSTCFGDDLDRTILKSNGERTYFANDLAYHYGKVDRGYKQLINIWGADHIGYIKRVKASVDALWDKQATLDIITCQLVNLMENGVKLKMSKRSGNFVTLEDILNVVGKDIFRFMMVTRSNNVLLDFDLSAVKEQSSDNPLYYVQYAYARIHSLLRHAQECFPEIQNVNFHTADLSLLSNDHDIDLIKIIFVFPRALRNTFQNNEPHVLYIFLMNLVTSFHSYWNKGKSNPDLRFVYKNNIDLTISRLALLKMVSYIIFNIANIFNVELKEHM